MFFRSSTIAFTLLLIIASCGSTEIPQKNDPPSDPSYREGNKIRFSGFDWKVKEYETYKWGPGPNYFSGHEDDITIDANGYLHMKIVKRNGKWMSTEVVSDSNMGYGTYVFTVQGDLENIPENIVLGLFTWDNNTFQKQANSEVDIEISKWGNKDDLWTLQYGVQPIYFGPYKPERVHRPRYELGELTGISTHAFTWTPDKISWVSFTGAEYGQGDTIAYWEFDKNNPSRTKEEGGRVSDPIVIPAPGLTTNARINFWITPWVAQQPTDGLEQEIIIQAFNYTPL